MNNYRMGGFPFWNEMTDIDAFHIVCDARSMSNKGTRNAFYHSDARAVVIDARFLEGGGDYYIDKKGNQGDFLKTKYVLAHEIGHNVFYNWYHTNKAGKNRFLFLNYPENIKLGSRFKKSFSEYTANLFMKAIGEIPLGPTNRGVNFNHIRYNSWDYENYLNDYLKR